MTISNGVAAALSLLLSSFNLTAVVSQSTPEPVGRMVDIGGRRLHLNCQGSGSPTVIVENGSGAFSIDWALVQPTVSQFVQVCTYDRAGYAWSDPAPIRDLPEQSVADFELMLLRAKLSPPYILVGQSIGAIHVRDYYRRNPQNVSGMVLVDPTHDEGLAYVIDGQPKPITFVTRSELQRFMQELLAKPSPVAAVVVRLSKPFDRLPSEMQSIRLWAETAYRSDQDRTRTPYLGESQRQLFFALRNERTAQRYPLGSMPLVVLTNRPNPQKSELALMSAAGTLRVVTDSCHEIHVCTPQAVIDAISSVVTAARLKRQ